ncbi:MgtC/SapB family protein [Clostridium perfringens]|uniref:MgtC/SapB family protein n=1 Tax=Clostridium perfringens TaxID=1502 RepID=UPI0010DA36EE|nr:MgtC/SapB family protein [Clostridium perfringens]MDK0754128.1 MgtC/SapB family protein [Clostridium perfringens]MDK0757304.1 MgtC/SapB family protein [Clostridium perfringens]NGT87591.1 MgtC/SapB family protein [Clostridium perfringens]VTQ55932.1 MgtC/SapB transporter [Clostridium perfringens]
MLDIYIQLIKLAIASIIGLIIGFERTRRKKAAGIGTFSIVCITSCLLTLISIHGLDEGADKSRLIANIITAIGFVAGGVIFTVNDRERIEVNGVTTGAEIFCVASLGIGIGLGLYEIVLTVVILVEINIVIAMCIKKYYKRKQVNKFKKCNSKEEKVINDLKI